MPSAKISLYRDTLRQLDKWEPYLLAESGLPGPRGNLELAQAVFDEGNAKLFERFLSYTPEKAPVNSPEEFLHFCGVFGQGKHLTKDSEPIWQRLKAFASDPRWRTREAVAMALQAYGDRDTEDLIGKMYRWAQGNPYEQRAVAAGLCEPRLLKRAENAGMVLEILDIITSSIATAIDRRDEGFKVLRQTMGYCWSVAVAAIPAKGKTVMEKWLKRDDIDVRRIMKDNLSKNRLIRIDEDWVDRWSRELA